MGKKRIAKARLLAYPTDWWYCIGIGYLGGLLTWPIITSLLT